MDKVARISPFFAVSQQISEQDLGVAASMGYKSVVNNRPDAESEDQPPSAALEAAAQRLGLAYRHLPVTSGKVTDADVSAFAAAMAELRGPVLAFCRTGTRSSTLWALSQADRLDPDAVLAATLAAGYDLEALRGRLDARWRNEDREGAAESTESIGADKRNGASGSVYDVVVVGGGAAGIAAAASLLRRRPSLSVAIVEPRDRHYYQPGWTLVGGGVFKRAMTERAMADVMPAGTKWIRAAAAGFEPEASRVVLEDGERIAYRTLVAAPGLKLDWDAVEGLRETLGKNGVTSNYLFEMAPYTWELVQSLREGRALFTQPPMPIKCAGAPQKAMYLSCDHWLRQGTLGAIDVEFDTAGAVLFGVKEFVPPLMDYVRKYDAALNFNSNLRGVDGPAGMAWFDVKRDDGTTETVGKHFDMLHVCPPQTAPDLIRQSPLAAESGWTEVSPETLQHQRFGNVFGLGDACSAPNAKTAAAVRKQAPVVAENVLSVLDGRSPRAIYDGYGSCPLTVERGKIVLAEFGYGGKLLPTFPFLDPDQAEPARLAAEGEAAAEPLLGPHAEGPRVAGRARAAAP